MANERVAATTARQRGGGVQARRAQSKTEGESFARSVGQEEEQVRGQEGFAISQELDHYRQAELSRRVLVSVFVQDGLMLLRRKRNPQRIVGRKTANFS